MRRQFVLGFSLFWTLVSSQDLLGQSTQGLEDRLPPIVKAQEQAKKEFNEGLEGKTTEEAQKPVYDRYLGELARNTDQVLELVRANPTDPAVVEALRFVIRSAGRGPGTQSYQAMEILLQGHVRDPGMGDLCGRIFHFRHARVAEALLRAVIASHPNREDRGLACFSLAELLELRGDMIRAVRSGRDKLDRYVDEPFTKETDRIIVETDLTALDHEVEVLYECVVAEFPDVKDWFMPDRPIGQVAEGVLFHRRNLVEGRVIPEITDKDHEGKSFSLSDYRGKVVVLTFSASWCGPCVGMYPGNRQLVKKLEGKPFALVSVHSDEKVDKLKTSIASGDITWRCWWDEGVYGPITTRWGVQGIPETYVLDRAGVIRKKNLRGEELEKAVMALMEEEDRKDAGK
jgi:thiol-disulfide isomerase/thioredoxin/predicted house-cleaning noncanonical NTP pyrophosphatase (MazG superfamily)